MSERPDQHIHLDLHRAERCGYPEVVYGAGKDVATLTSIFRVLLDRGFPVLATRVDSEKAAELTATFPTAQYSELARTFRIDPADQGKPPQVGDVAVVSAGTSDAPVAAEAYETLRWMGCRTQLIQDVGVAGPHRLAERLEEFAASDAVVVVAGMEGALPSVVGGYVACPVVAVPTSVGYGANLGGISALLSMLNSCAANVTVVNIDAGFKGGYVAGLIAQRGKRGHESAT